MKRVEHIGDATLYLGDCLEIMPTLGKFDAVVTDPPYGLGEKLRGGISGMMGGCFNEMVDAGWDVKPDDYTLQMVSSAGTDFIVWGGNYFCKSFEQSPCVLIWDKINGTNPMADCEIAFTSFDKGSRMFSRHHFSKGCGGKEHPTQKPLPVMLWCLSFLSHARTILDPFMGSGTTGVACVKLGRKFVGIEIEPKYFEIACKRIQAAYDQPDMFIEQSKTEQPKQEALL